MIVKNPRRFRLDKTAVLFFAAAIVLTAAAAFCMHYEADVLHRNIQYRIEEMLRSHRNAVLSGLSAQSNALAIASCMVERCDGSIEECIDFAPAILDEMTKADRVALTQQNGIGLLTDGSPADISGSDVFALLQQGADTAVCIGRTSAEEDETFLMANVIRRDNADTLILAASYSVQDICEVLLRGSHAADGCVLLNENGDILMRIESDNTQSGQNILQSMLGMDSENENSVHTLRNMLASEEMGYVKYQYFGEEWYLAFADLGVSGWKVACRVRAVEFDYMHRVLSTIHWSLYVLSMAFLSGLAFRYVHDLEKRAKQRRLEEARNDGSQTDR